MFARGRGSWRGQVLVVFAGGLVALLAIAALVIDLGFAFMIRRAEQNAVDPGAVAAARIIRDTSIPSPSDKKNAMDAAACFYAQQNGFFSNAPGFPTDSGCTEANDPDGTKLNVYWPPSTNAGTFAGDDGKVEVVLGRQHVTFLARVIGIGQIGVASSAVAANDDGNSNSSSLIALDPGGCAGNAAGWVTGGGTIKIEPVDPSIEGGFVHINSSCGSDTGDDACLNGSGALKVESGKLEAPKVFIVGSCQGDGPFPLPATSADGLYTNALDEGSVIIGDPLADLPPPSFSPPGAFCGDPLIDPGVIQTTEVGAEGCNFNNKDTTYHLSPGVYYGGWKVNGKNVTLHLDEGTYIIAGGDLSISATGELTSVFGTTGPAPVMIFSTDNPLYAAACKAGTSLVPEKQCQNKIDFTAGSDLLLKALTSGPYKGILIWMDGDGSAATDGPNNSVTLSGQTSLSLSGTIYNPRGTVDVGGGGSGTGYAAVQIISWHWKVHGGGLLEMPYDPSALYQFTYKGLVR